MLYRQRPSIFYSDALWQIQIFKYKPVQHVLCKAICVDMLLCTVSIFAQYLYCVEQYLYLHNIYIALHSNYLHKTCCTDWLVFVSAIAHQSTDCLWLYNTFKLNTLNCNISKNTNTNTYMYTNTNAYTNSKYKHKYEVQVQCCERATHSELKVAPSGCHLLNQTYVPVNTNPSSTYPHHHHHQQQQQQQWQQQQQ